MSTSRPFAYNIGSRIAGTEQIGDLAIGFPTNGFDSTGLQWWNGPDEDLGYVIAYPVPDGNHPTPISGLTSYLGFVGTKNMANPFLESTFLDLVNTKFNQNFTSGNDASAWLTTNGYWNSWESITPTPTPTINETLTPTPTPTVTPTVTPTTTNTPTPTSSGGVEVLINPIIVGLDEYLEVGTNEYLMFIDPEPVESPTPTPTQTVTPTPTQTVTPTITPTITPTSSEVPVTPTPTPSVTPSSGPAPSGFTVTISEVGSDVVWSASGSLDLSNLSFEAAQNISAGFNGNTAIWAVGPTVETTCDAYVGVAFSTFPATFGTGGAPANSGTGDILSILENGIGGRKLLVPENYISGTQISGSTTYQNTTISSLQLITGTYIYSWGGNPGETITLTIE